MLSSFPDIWISPHFYAFVTAFLIGLQAEYTFTVFPLYCRLLYVRTRT